MNFSPSFPREFAAVIQALRFGDDGTILATLDDEAWNRVLALCDREHLTFHLYRVRANGLSENVTRRIESGLARNEERVRRVQAVFEEIKYAFENAGIEAAVLKGFTQYPAFVPELRYRVQYDLDFFCPEESIYRARDVLKTLSYEPLQEMEDFPTDHLPLMIQKTGWQWRGDFFDPDIPVSVDLHYRFWDSQTERLEAPGIERFWPRAQHGVLHRVDAVAYHCLHLLRHLLRSSLRLSHVYELAWFLQTHSRDREFWQDWESLHPEGLRQLQAVSFNLARTWFHCSLAPQASEEIRRLQDDVRRWFDYYAYSPMEKLFRPNKHELWLHLSLLNSYAAKGSVLRRRLFPARLPGPVDAVYVGENELTLRRRLLRNFRYASHVAERALHHARVLPSVALHGVWWHSRGSGLTQKFWAFIGAASLFNFGLFIFVLTYNLYLLDRGYREDFLGFVNGAFTAGSVAGALPAGAILQRFGISSAFQFCIGGTALVSTMRALIPGDAVIIALAFAGGVFFSLWAVMIAPAIAQLTEEQSRARGFSLFFGISIAVGVLGGLIGGHLPDWLETKQGALLCGCGFTLTALWPAKFLSFSTGYRSARPKYPFDSFIRRFLLALAGWNLAVGAFNPFFNIFFARHLNARMDQIGMIFSAGQLAQVAAMAAAPIVLKKLGLVNGVMATQIAAGTALAMLTATNGIMSAATVYVCYAAFQYMSEPGVYTLLMSRVQPEEQSGASSLNFLATFSAHAISATIAGTAFSWYGYNRVVPVIAAVVILSAFLFRMLLRRFEVRRAGTVPE